jgi:hypothetical protein
VLPKLSLFGKLLPRTAGASPGEMNEQSRSNAAVLFKSIVEVSG